MSILTVDGLSAGYSRVPVVTDVALASEPGKIAVVVGPNGAGKSTMLKAVMGILRPMSGTILLADQDVTGWEPHRVARAGIGYVPQVNNVFPALSVIENLEMGAFTRKGDIKERMNEVLAMFPDLRDAAKRPAVVLSGGQRNMLGMARALMLDPKVLLLDEPTAGRGPMYVGRIWDRVSAIAATETSVVVVEQNVDLALEHADWAYIMIAGRNYMDGPAQAIKQADLAAIFLGEARPDRAVGS